MLCVGVAFLATETAVRSQLSSGRELWARVRSLCRPLYGNVASSTGGCNHPKPGCVMNHYGCEQGKDFPKNSRNLAAYVSGSTELTSTLGFMCRTIFTPLSICFDKLYNWLTTATSKELLGRHHTQ